MKKVVVLASLLALRPRGECCTLAFAFGATTTAASTHLDHLGIVVGARPRGRTSVTASLPGGRQSCRLIRWKIGGDVAFRAKNVVSAAAANDDDLKDNIDVADCEADQLYLERFRRRRDDIDARRRLQGLRDERQAEDPRLDDPCDFVAAVLEGLLFDGRGRNGGARTLLRSSTDEWRDVLRKSVGAPREAEEDSVAAALDAAMRRPGNQFGILVGAAEDDEYDDEVEYKASFPTEPVDYGDGTCWVECRLRGKIDNGLLAVTGWSLNRQNLSDDGEWLVDGIDWQDFRDRYRPGIGREEWERICG